jgi:biopolymer transport protein ExbD
MEVYLRGRKTVAEVNVVPLIDILLVLLVIFMIIPHQQMGLSTVLPQSSDVPPMVLPVVVQLRADGSMWINRLQIAPQELRDRLNEIFRSRAERVAFVRGDNELQFAAVAGVIDVMKAARIDSVGLLTPELEKDR